MLLKLEILLTNSETERVMVIVLVIVRLYQAGHVTAGIYLPEGYFTF